MSQPYEQMTAHDNDNDNQSGNPFSRGKKDKGFGEIVQNKNRVVKYVLILGVAVAIVVLVSFAFVKSGQLKMLNEKKETLSNDIKEIEKDTSFKSKSLEDFNDSISPKKQRKEEIDQLISYHQTFKDDVQKKIEKNKVNSIKYDEESNTLRNDIKENQDKLGELKTSLESLKKEQKEKENLYNDLNLKLKELNEKLLELEQS